MPAQHLVKNPCLQMSSLIKAQVREHRDSPETRNPFVLFPGRRYSLVATVVYAGTFMEVDPVGVSVDTVEASTVFPGFKFSPTDVELISYYLKRKMDGLERSVEVIPETDIYNFEPWDLPDKSIVKSDTEWFFFCPRGKKYPHGSQNRRTTKMGYWKATGKERDVKSSSEVVGTKRTLVFHIGRAPKGERTEWIMHEYSMKGSPLDDALVVCRLRRNREFHKAPEPNLAADKHMILPNDPASSGRPSDWDSMIDFYLAGEPGENLLTEMAETSRNVQVHADEDFFADILSDEIINLDEAVTTGKTPNEVPTLESAASAIRVLPLPTMIDKQMVSLLEERQPQEKEGKESSCTEPLSSCFVGLYSIKTVNRVRWDVIIGAVALIAMLFYLEEAM
ncbi:NAC domain-containing protein 89 [Brassica rapa]|nr:NAC domain-containing protein 89 [Brassica rapa]